MPLHNLRLGLLAASVTAAIGLAGAPAASAADLYGGHYDHPPVERYAEDPYPAAPHAYYPSDVHEGPPIRYTDRHASPYGAVPPYGRDDDVAPRYAAPRHAGDCVARWQVRKQLRRDGWADIYPLGHHNGLVTLRARRQESGRVFLLDVDRCSGEIVHARPDYLRSYGEGPVRYPRRTWY